MFDFWKNDRIYYITEEGLLVDKPDNAVLMANPKWSHYIPVFMYINAMVPDNELGAAYVHIQWEGGSTVFCVITADKSLRTDTMSAVQGMLNILSETEGDIGAWNGNIVVRAGTYRVEGSDDVIKSVSDGEFEVPTVLPKVKYAERESLSVGIPDIAFMDLREYLMAIIVACGKTDEFVSFEKDNYRVATSLELLLGRSA